MSGLVVRIACLLAPTAVVAAGGYDRVLVDQFGYRPESVKIVVFASPQKGKNADAEAKRFRPGGEFQVRRARDGGIAFTGGIKAWRGGAVHGQSGDKAWQGDFTALKVPGAYYVLLPGGTHPGTRSFEFRIEKDVFQASLVHSVRSFYYQRCGCAIGRDFGGVWNHEACHVRPGQDRDARLWKGEDKGEPRDVSGGWHDAGDYRKYVPWVYNIVWQILHAAEWYPDAFGDRTGIPESGNGVPDVLDECKYELDWLMCMQFPDGGVASVVGVTGGDGGSPPERDRAPRYYGGKSTVAASTVASCCALAARLFSPYGGAYPGYAEKLKEASLKAWDFLDRHPGNLQYEQGGFEQVNANVNDAGDSDRRLAAAAELFHLTGESRFRGYFDSNYDRHRPRAENEHHPITRGYFETGASGSLQMALVSYAGSPGASPFVAERIRKSLLEGATRVMDQAGSDPYLAHMWDGHYCWGSNAIKLNWASLPLYAVRLGVQPARNARFMARAEDYLHYINGRNPLNIVYLTNMGERGARAGAERSVMEMYHGWFHDGSREYDGETSAYGPAPGFMPGGPNGTYTILAPPAGEPPMKAYRDWNTAWPENSWEVTENAVGYQSGHVFVAAAFASNR